MSVHDPRVVIRTEEGLYVGWAPDNRVALHRDPRAAFVYDTDLEDVDAQIAVVHGLYGKVWTAVPLAQALADAGVE
jgi:hypothetical protein